MKSNWAHATSAVPRPERECPRCGEERMVDLVDSPKHPMMYCNMCGHNWRLRVKSKDAHD